MSCPSITPTHNINIPVEIPPENSLPVPLENRSTSPWAKMFNGGASPEELTQFINGFLNTMIAEMKRADKKWKLQQQEQKRNFS